MRPKTNLNQDKTIIRCVERRRWITVGAHIYEDPSISWEAKAVLTYLLGKPDGWLIRVHDLWNKSTNGRDSIYKILNELREAGYIKRSYRYRDNGGKGLLRNGYEYVVYEEKQKVTKEDLETPKNKFAPKPRGLKKCLRNPENQDTDNQDTENQGTLEEKESSKEDIKDTENTNPKAPKTEKKSAIAENGGASVSSSSSNSKETHQDAIKASPSDDLKKNGSEPVKSKETQPRPSKPGKSMIRAKSKYATGNLLKLGTMYEGILLYQGEYDWLKQEHGEKFINSLIDELDDAIASKGYQYTDHFATLRNWIKRREDQKTQPNKGNSYVQKSRPEPIKPKHEPILSIRKFGGGDSEAETPDKPK